jgi:hypothetical protein
MYERRSRLSTRKQMEISRMFATGTNAWGTAAIVGVHLNIATSFSMCRRLLIAGSLPSYELSR